MEMLTYIATGSKFSKFDIKEAYIHMSVTEENCLLLVENTRHFKKVKGCTAKNFRN